MVRAKSVALLSALSLCFAGGSGTAATGKAAGPGNIQSVAITYDLVAKGITVGTGTYSYNFKGDGYTGSATHRLIGFARRIVGKRQDFSYSVSGDVTPDGRLKPRNYRHQGGSRNRIVTVDFGDRAVTTQATPSMGMGKPPATPAQKLNTIDQVTMMAALMVVASDPCNQTQRIFLEGRTRFDLDLNPAGTQKVDLVGYRGQAIRCSVRFTPVAGFPDPMDATTLTFLFAPTNGVFVPIQIQMPTEEAGLVRLEARRVSIVGNR